ncbi:AAA family ATPase [Marinobacterium litorale]|uniref:AAA family ATPase n=1 Tax=Marinobacterium litorale TaxID=404770 RepID=UPI0003FC4627|nr:AAA family ATPase [Marinobacterium litorale]
MANTVSPTQAVSIISHYIRAGVVPMVTGSPGIGKSSIVKQIADEYELQLIDMRLSQCDPTDLLGFPTVNEVVVDEQNLGKRASYAPMSTFPLKGDTLPKGKKGWLLFLDEFNSASIATQAAAYKLILDRQVGQHDLHENVAIVAAGNLGTDGAIVNRQGTAMQSRLGHITIDIDPKGWIDWASRNGVDHRICAFINYKGENLHKFDPQHNDRTFACPRTWEFTSNVIKPMTDISMSDMPLLSGLISEGMANEFIGYCKVYKDLLTFEQICQNPNGVQLPSEPSVYFALSGTIADKVDDKTIDKAMAFLNRAPAEFQVLTLRDIVRRKRELMQSAPVRTWIASTAAELL